MEKFASPGKGYGLRLLRPAKAGELLYRAAPFAYAVTKKRLGGVCERCLRRKKQLLRCSQCKVARYCDTHCQKEAWQDHKRECKCIKSVDPNFPPDSVRLVGRIVFKIIRQTPCPSEELYSFSDLKSHAEDLTEEMKEGIGHLAKTLQLYLKAEIQDASQLPPALDIFQTFAKEPTMSTEITGYIELVHLDLCLKQMLPPPPVGIFECTGMNFWTSLTDHIFIMKKCNLITVFLKSIFRSLFSD